MPAANTPGALKPFSSKHLAKAEVRVPTKSSGHSEMMLRGERSC